eukprot:6198084-Pleurochrysis_carterae.AAC.2
MDCTYPLSRRELGGGGAQRRRWATGASAVSAALVSEMAVDAAWPSAAPLVLWYVGVAVCEWSAAGVLRKHVRACVLVASHWSLPAGRGEGGYGTAK